MGLIVLFVAALALVGCKAALVREPSFGAHTIPVDQWVGELDDPPPPVQAEEVSPDPGPSYVWIDGQWVWQPLTRRWTWDQGVWCVPPPGALYYARAGVERYRAIEGRIKRWNGAQQRFEEVDSGDDRFRWARGRFYVRGQDGLAVPSKQTALCPKAAGTQTR